MLRLFDNPKRMFRMFVANRGLIAALTVREVLGRYRGSMLGMFWAVFQPILMLAVYTFVFGVIFRSRWPGGTGSRAEFALVLFSGLLVFNMFAECLNRAPSIILSNVNYVKRVVFPLEILPLVAVAVALFHLFISFLVWLVFYLIAIGVPSVTVLLFPIALLPLIFLSLGIAWFFSALGVFIRDTAQITGLFTTVLMFLSPIFYSADSIPARFRPVAELNPLVPVIEQVRRVLMWHEGLDLHAYLPVLLLSIVVLFGGFWWFEKTRKGFADVL
ncbi:Transport permease protein [Paraburkholderia tropica]|uniref:ABC transporter permease n=1 Tax=Paraburkholderia tropica TaxID=92647 RepID=UPI001CB53928|nr:ABC transporter permease [Paraburkholderia tropica]CAG9234250.1 Transport permease protein [Paraburkholderia tropica]